MFEFVYEIIYDEVSNTKQENLKKWLILGKYGNDLFTDDFIKFNQTINALQTYFATSN